MSEAPPEAAVLTIERAEQLRALGHPLRLRVLDELGRGGHLTNRELAVRLGVDPGRLHFHVRLLHRAGLIERVEKGHGREKPYRAVAPTLRVSPELVSTGIARDAQAALLDEVQRGWATFAPQGAFRGTQLTLRLDADEARKLVREFMEKMARLEDERAEPIVLTLFLHPPPPSGA